jgi:hypothetical protein
MIPLCGDDAPCPLWIMISSPTARRDVGSDPMPSEELGLPPPSPITLGLFKANVAFSSPRRSFGSPDLIYFKANPNALSCTYFSSFLSHVFSLFLSCYKRPSPLRTYNFKVCLQVLMAQTGLPLASPFLLVSMYRV